MISTKLILVDGISTTGKSNTSQYTSIQLMRNQFKPRWYHEFEKPSPLGPPSKPLDNEDAFTQLLKLWSDYTAKFIHSNEIVIVEALFQIPILGLLWMGYSKDQIVGFYTRLYEIIRPLDPVFVYLRHADVKKNMMDIYRERNTDEARVKTLCDIMLSNNYCRKNNLIGMDGVISYWVYIDGIIAKRFGLFHGNKLELTVDRNSWKASYGKLFKFLDIAEKDSIVIDPSLLERYTGTYPCEHDNKPDRFFIETRNGELMLIDFPWSRNGERNPDYRLIPETETSFYIAGLPYGLTFMVEKYSVYCEQKPVFGIDDQSVLKFYKENNA